MIKYTDEEFLEAVNSSNSILEILHKLNLAPSGAAYKSIYKSLIYFNIDCSKWNVSKKQAKLFNIETDIFVENSKCYSSTLRRHVIKSGKFEWVCSICGLKEWLNKPITLQIDHKNGDRSDNRIENLRLLCPNCHSQTDTWCRTKEENKSLERMKKINTCECGKNIGKLSRKCRTCAAFEEGEKHIKIDWPTTKELIKMIEETSCVKVAKLLGVSNTAVTKRIRNHPV